MHCIFGSTARSMHRTSISLFPSCPIISSCDLNTPRVKSSNVATYAMLESGSVTATDVDRVVAPCDSARVDVYEP